MVVSTAALTHVFKDLIPKTVAQKHSDFLLILTVELKSKLCFSLLGKVSLVMAVLHT